MRVHLSVAGVVLLLLLWGSRFLALAGGIAWVVYVCATSEQTNGVVVSMLRLFAGEMPAVAGRRPLKLLRLYDREDGTGGGECAIVRAALVALDLECLVENMIQ